MGPAACRQAESYIQEDIVGFQAVTRSKGRQNMLGDPGAYASSEIGSWHGTGMAVIEVRPLDSSPEAVCLKSRRDVPGTAFGCKETS